MNFDKKVACGSFVKRQTKGSNFSYYDGSWDHLEWMIEYRLKNSKSFASKIKQGYRDGVLIVDLYPNDFYSSTVKLNEKSKFSTKFASRREGEMPYINVAVVAEKQRAKQASVVLYRHDILDENNERETNAEWEVVAIKAQTSDEIEPMPPMTMARNFLHLEGGTKGDFTAEDFAKSIVYWNTHAMCMPRQNIFKRIFNWIKSCF